MENITPMLKQYQGLKAQYKDSILFFRLGDFYEMFFDDAKVSAPILNVTLTSRDAGRTGRIPMCGIPYHSKDNYIAKLIKAGLKVAICEQTEDTALSKGLVQRDVTRIITAGTFIDEANYESRYLFSIILDDKTAGISFIDTISGKIQINEYPDIIKIIELMSKLEVYECIFPVENEEKIKEIFRHPLLKAKNITLSPQMDWSFNIDISRKSLCEHFKTQNLNGFGIENLDLAIASSGALLEYLKQMNQMPMRHICKISRYIDTDYVFLSPHAVYGLEIEELFKTIDRTVTALGKRCLKNWVYRPLKVKDEIIERQTAVRLLKDNPAIQEKLGGLLRNIPDIEKNISRISYNAAAAKDLIALRNTLIKIPEIQKTLCSLKQQNPLFLLEDIPETRDMLEQAINPDTPLSNSEGKIIRKGFNEELDRLRDIQENAKQLLARLQAKEIKRTGINSLKIGYNHVFGYTIEITKANLDSIPADYIRKQTLANAERFITPELKEYEEKILTAQEDLLKIEEGLLKNIYKHILDNCPALQLFSSKIALLDCLYSLSIVASSDGYITPEISEDTRIEIKEGRHPVVERFLSGSFIPNDTLLDCNQNHLSIITGPNMSGKSTYIRQTAVLVILAQIGSFIPAKSANIGLVDKIFTRIGAYDEISKGQSTFMVEMSETADILNNLSSRSLIILDEIGRGTSTYDGLSLAWAIAEYLQKQKTRALFATHFHELTALAKDYSGVKNYNVAVKEWQDKIVFLHKIIPGGTDDSYGIYVAKLAGIPYEVINRAKQILIRLELNGKLHDKIREEPVSPPCPPLTKKDKGGFLDEMVEEINDLDINSLTPLSALNKIHDWKRKLNNNTKNVQNTYPAP